MRCWNFFAHSSRKAFVQSDTDVGKEGLAHSDCSISSQWYSLLLTLGLCVSRSKLIQPCLYGPCFVNWNTFMLGRKRVFPKTVTAKLEAKNCLKCPGKLTHKISLHLPTSGNKKNPIVLSLLHQTLLFAPCHQTGNMQIQSHQ